ncbi:hypothetical protein BVX99_01570 [bacterium F16]|nr:hypothetical protein BVX99_01570 [bacterium F16]
MYKALDKWLLPYLKRPLPELPEKGTFLFCICDHFEPFHGTDKAGAIERVQTWREELPALSKYFEKTVGLPLKWTMFYPLEQYDPDILNELAMLCQTGCAEAEVHLHHSDDTPENLAETLLDGKEKLRAHGLLSVDELDQTRFAFIHGNWAINNSHPDGKHCGVDNEAQVLTDWGCISDLTMPSAPSPCQTETINSIYYAAVDDEGNVNHSAGSRVTAGDDAPKESLLMIQGPLALNKQKKKFGLLPGIENGDLTLANPPTYERLSLWANLGISVEGRGEWVVVKLHTHGADPENMGALLGEPMRQFAHDLARFMEEKDGWNAHFVTARQLTNIIKAAEKGESGNPMDYCDFLYKPVALPSLEEPIAADAAPEQTPSSEPRERPFKRVGSKLFVQPNPKVGRAVWIRRREA